MEEDTILQQDYRQWERTHARMKESPPQNGHDYLKHAKNLLVLLEGVAELNPVAKAVVVSFKTAVMFEQDRRENDARVTAVFLAQTDVMRVLLDVDDIASRRRYRPNVEILRSNVTLNDILSAIQKEIKACGNSIDTYYKESRFVKFWKAQDWKNRMLGHINQFNQLRNELQQTLSVQVASGVEDIAVKMDEVLSRLYAPRYDWEKSLDMKTRGLEFMDPSWIEGPDTLRNLLLDTNDPSLPAMSPAGQAKDISTQIATDMQLSKVKREIQSSLDALCDRNMDMFELRLNFHAQQMEQVIMNSAHLVIQSLSGPSDRLLNKDLRQLWKEMDWIFCVENKFFVSALFEFYLDQFSSHKPTHNFIFPDNQTDDTVQLEKDREETLKKLLFSSTSVPKFTFLSRLGALTHPDAWTLEYIALHGHHITRAIDNDCSGFIRISEANSFTQQIPKGWTLPQWCAYSAAGWAYEARIYRRRMSKIMTVLTDMQAKVLESNRAYLIIFSLISFHATYHAFTREPTGQSIPPVTQELRELVKHKVLAQDALYRSHLQKLRWTVEDESTLHLLYGEMAPEKYILQFGTLMLEQFLSVSELCRTATIDAKDWLRLSSASRLMREVSLKRVSELQGISTFHGGIWSFVRQQLDTGALAEGMKPYTAQELTEYQDDLPILEDFPIPTDVAPYIQYSTWEQYLQTAGDEAKDLSVIPKTWNPLNDTALPHLVDRAYIKDFPMQGWNCDRCGETPAQQKRYRCIDISCPDFDLCQECYSLPQPEHKAVQHKFNHHVMLSTLWLMPEQEQKIALEILVVLEQIRQEISALQRSQSTVVKADMSERRGTPTDGPEASKSEEGAEEPKLEEASMDSSAVTPDERNGAVLRITDTDNAHDTEETTTPLSEKNEERDSGELESAEKRVDDAGHIATMPILEVTSTPQENATLVENDSPEQNLEITSLYPDENVHPIATVDALIGNEAETDITSDHAKPGAQSSDKDTKIEVAETIDVSSSSATNSLPLIKKFSKCAFERFEEVDDAAHQWWHSLFVFRKDILFEEPSEQQKEVAGGNDQQVVSALEVSKDQIISQTIDNRISKLEQKFSELNAAIQSGQDSLASAIQSTLETKFDRITSLEAKVERLENKMDSMMTTLMELLGGLSEKKAFD
uniref:ZZ-type domain-containing protein n=1 Tax=Psilocybe cubensis TaxID=181762 RepID=A0A8H7Y3G6_PSICU